MSTDKYNAKAIRAANAGKEKVMSEEKNGENGWRTFTLEATNPDYNIMVRVHEDYFEGCDPAAVFLLANRDGYNHVYSNEKSSAGTGFMKNNPNATEAERTAFEHSWMLKKRQAIVDGDYSRGTRGGPRGPRLSELEQEKYALGLAEVKARWAKNNDPDQFPKERGKDKGLINGQEVSYWVKAVLARFPEMTVKAQQNIDARKAEAEAAKAKFANVDDAFADLAQVAAV